MATHEQTRTREFTLDGVRYRTDASWLLASDKKKGIFLYRAHNSNYFLYSEGEKDPFKLLCADDARSLYHELSVKLEPSQVNAFPSFYGGIGLDTPTRYDYEEQDA